MFLVILRRQGKSFCTDDAALPVLDQSDDACVTLDGDRAGLDGFEQFGEIDMAGVAAADNAVAANRWPRLGGIGREWFVPGIFNNDAIRLVEEGVAEPEEIDKAIKGALGYKMGPMELLDLVGLDTQILLCEALYGITGEKRASCPPLLRRMVAAGRLGRKTERGFLNYNNTAIFGA